jgi:nucleotidyltransferase/DNA polymerase involved in DNA repair
MRDGSSRVIASACQTARALGLRPGMTVTHAQALVPDLTVVEATPDEDEAGLHRLALWCLWCAPLVAPDPPDGVFIDIDGSAHLFGGEKRVRRRTRPACGRADLSAPLSCVLIRVQVERDRPVGRKSGLVLSGATNRDWTADMLARRTPLAS